MPPQFRLRPGSVSDLNHAVRLYDACLGSDKLIQLLFPGKREQDPVAFKTHLYRLYAKRFWSVEWMFTFIVREAGEEVEEEVVGFSCWKKPAGEIGFVERWFSICEFSLFFSSHHSSYLRQLVLSLLIQGPIYEAVNDISEINQQTNTPPQSPGPPP
jgi:hypothetical protein